MENKKQIYKLLSIQHLLATLSQEMPSHS